MYKHRSRAYEQRTENRTSEVLLRHVALIVFNRLRSSKTNLVLMSDRLFVHHLMNCIIYQVTAHFIPNCWCVSAYLQCRLTCIAVPGSVYTQCRLTCIAVSISAYIQCRLTSIAVSVFAYKQCRLTCIAVPVSAYLQCRLTCIAVPVSAYLQCILTCIAVPVSA